MLTKLYQFLKPSATKRLLFYLGADLLFTLFTLYLAYLLRFNFYIEARFLETFWRVYALLALLKIATFYYFNLYYVIWRFFSLVESRQLAIAHIIAYSLFALIFYLFSDYLNPFPRSVIFIDFALSLLVLGLFRASKRLVLSTSISTNQKPSLVIGVNDASVSFVKNALTGHDEYYPIALISSEDDETLTQGYIQQLRVLSLAQMPALVQNEKIEAAIIAPDIKGDALNQIYDTLEALNIYDIKRIHTLSDNTNQLQELSIEELLAREPKDLDKEAIRAFIAHKSVLITGAGGSIGSEIAKQCHQFGAKALILVDNSEFNLYSIGEALPHATLSLTSVTNAEALSKLFAVHAVDIVVHAAAYKHVPICEINASMAIANNVIGTKNIIDVSIEHAVKKVVIISTDKAVRPTNVMGTTKRIGELYAQNVDAKETEIAAVRFGNVLGSSGSVIPKFKRLIEEGKNLTVTHPQMTRYFMMITEACQLVLQAAAMAKGGELFILDMGKPVKIDDLARAMIRLYGKQDEIGITYTGLRAGEKMYEELLISDAEAKTKYESIYVANPTPYGIATLQSDIETLLHADDKIAQLQKIVPEYYPSTTPAS